jgi:hypothetical protein
MYSFINRPIGQKNTANELRIKRMNYLINKNKMLKKSNTVIQQNNNSDDNNNKQDNNKQDNNKQDNNKQDNNKQDNNKQDNNKQDNNKQDDNDKLGLVIYNFDKINTNVNVDNIHNAEKIELNISELNDVPSSSVPFKEANNQQLFVLKHNIISLIRLSCISNITCKNILDELNANTDNSNSSGEKVVSDIWTCVNGIAEAIDPPKEKKFTIDKTKIEKIKEEEEETNKSQLINYKEEMLSKVDHIFTKAVDNMSSGVVDDIIQYTNVIIQHSRKSLHERLDQYLNSFLDNLFK